VDETINCKSGTIIDIQYRLQNMGLQELIIQDITISSDKEYQTKRGLNTFSDDSFYKVGDEVTFLLMGDTISNIRLA